MQPISYTCISISCNCRFMMFRKKIIKMPNLTLTIYPITCRSFNWIGQLVGLPSFGAALALFVVSRRTRVSGKCPRGKCPGGNVRSPVCWCGQQNSSTVELVYCPYTTVERIAAECMRQIIPGHWHCHRSIFFRIRLPIHVSIKLYVDLCFTICEM